MADFEARVTSMLSSEALAGPIEIWFQDEARVAHVADRANSAAMNEHLAAIGAAVAPGAHDVIILDGAGWHRSGDLLVPPPT